MYWRKRTCPATLSYGPAVAAFVRRPAGVLAAFVESIEYGSVDRAQTSRELVLPEPSVSLWMNLTDARIPRGDDPPALRLQGAMVCGPFERAVPIELESDRRH